MTRDRLLPVAEPTPVITREHRERRRRDEKLRKMKNSVSVMKRRGKDWRKTQRGRWRRRGVD